MKPEDVRAFYESDPVVDHYFRATNNVGLWQSEKIIFGNTFSPDASLLELGCASGRIAFGLWKLGWKNITALDYSQRMIDEAVNINNALGSNIRFMQGDALMLPFEDESFDGAIFGFNGLMQNPGEARRIKILQEIHRVVKSAGCLVFTTHDQEHPAQKAFWEEEKIRWQNGTQCPLHKEFGDRCETFPIGTSFMHVPTHDEILRILNATGWTSISSEFRSSIAVENDPVREFSDDCRFWVIKKNPV